MSKNTGLTRDAVDAIGWLIHDFRYEYEGSRDTDSIEEWVDRWIENKKAVEDD